MSTHEPTKVLDYAPNPAKRPIADHFVPIAIVLATTIFGAFLQSRFQPIRYTSIGFLQVTPPPPPGAVTAHVAALQVLAPNLPQFRTSPLYVRPADLSANLKVTAVPSSRLIAVSFTSDTPNQTAAVVNTLMAAYVAQAPGITIAVPGAVPATPHATLAFTIAGGFAGAIIGMILVWLRHRRLTRRT